eukprot:jgi/Tetstr1/454194/TSEL_041113.t1
MDSSFVTFTVSARSRVVAGSYLFDGAVGASGAAAGIGAQTAVDQIQHGPSVPVTYLDDSSGTLFVGGSGVTVLPQGSADAPSVSDYSLVLLAHPAPVSVEQAQALLKSGSYDPATSDEAAVAGVEATGVTLRAGNLVAGTTYTFSIHGYSAAEGYVTTVLATGTTTVDPVIDLVAAARKITAVDLSFQVTEVDSDALLRAAVVPLSATAATVEAALAADTHPGDVFERVVGPGTSAVATTVAGLDPGTAYRVVAVAVDAVTGNVTTRSDELFTTYPEPAVAVTQTGRTYSSVAALSAHAFQMDGVDVATAVVPNTPADIAAFLASGADPLGTLTTTSYPAFGSYTSAFGASGLAQGVPYAAVSKVVPRVQPDEYRYDVQVVRTAQQPSIVIGPHQVNFFDAVAPFRVADPDETVNVYAAIHRADTDPPNVAESNLLALGSTAYPRAIVATGVAAFSNDMARYDLQPDTLYYFTVVAVETSDRSLVTSLSEPFVTFPTPVITLGLDSFTDITLSASVTSTGVPHDLFVHITPYVVGGSPGYDAAAIAATAVSDASTFIIPGGQSNAVLPVFSGLAEHTSYGVVALTAQIGTHTVLSQEVLVAKTAALPDLAVDIDAVAYNAVHFSVTGVDLDGPFRVLTAVATSAFSSADADAFAAAGMAYAASGVVPGTQTDFPNDVDARFVDFDFAHSNLLHDTDYVAVAVAVDAGSGVIQWAQQPFLTDFRPTVSVSAVDASSFAAAVHIVVADRDGPQLAVRYRVFPEPPVPGFTGAVLAGDPAAATLVSAGTGPRAEVLHLTGLREGTPYYLGVAAVSPDGTVSEAAVRAFTTDSRPTLALGVDEILARSLRTVLDVQPGSAATFDAAVALFPYGTAVDDALLAGVLAGSACNMITQDLSGGHSAPISRETTFAGLPPGARLLVVGAAARGDGDGDVVHAASNLYTRVEPRVEVVAAPAVTSTTVVAPIVLGYTDPDAGRVNSADVAVSLVPAGDTSLAWLAVGAASNPVVPAAGVLARAGVDALAASYAASNLTPATTYDLVVRAEDPLLAQAFVATTRFTTRHAVALAIAAAAATPADGTVDVTASLPDGTFDLFVDVFEDTAGTGQPLDGWYAVALASGTRLDSGVSFTSQRHTFGALASRRDYVAVALAVDAASGEAFRAHAAFTTSSHPPTVSVVNGSAVATSSSATLQLLARDVDSGVTCYARAFARANADPVDASVVALTISDPDFTRAFHPSAAETPFPVTVTGLTPDTEYRLVAVAQDAVTLSNAYDFEDFATVRREDYLERVEYDNEYTLSWRRTAAYSEPVRGVQVANGKIAFRTRLDDAVGVTDVVLGGSFDFNAYGGYTNNLVQAFDTCGLSLFDHSLGPAPASFSLSNQDLDMRAGIVRNTGRMVHAPTGAVLDVEHDVMALRQMPYCLLNMYRVTARADVAGDVRVFHETAAGPGMDGVTFDSATVYHPGLDMSVPVFQAAAAVRGSSHSIAAATVYMFDGATLSNVDHSGYNTFRNLDRAFDTHVVRGGLAAGVTYSWATLTAQATSADFPHPARELPRLLLQTLGSARPSPNALYDVALRLRADHVTAWDGVWRTSATLTPKAGLTVDDTRDFYRVKRALRFAQFQLFASVRDHGTAELNPLHLTSVDVDGNLFWNRELWVVPALIYFRPRAVRAMLESRFDSLRAAKTLAAAQGHEGARFPYVGDVLTYGAAPYWDVASASYVFNTALVAMAAWDYFRATHDRDWLLHRGFPILSAIADYICSVATVDGGTGRTSFPDVLDLNGDRVTDPVLTVYLCRSALKGAIEATYELRYPRSDAWVLTYSGLAVQYHGPAAPSVLRCHSAATLADSDIRLLEPLVALQPHYIADFLRGDVPRLVTNDADTILANAAHYSSAMSPSHRDNPFNTLMRMSLYAQVNRSTGAHSASCHALLLKAIDDAERDIWGALSASPSSAYNDVSLSALLLLAFVTSFAGMHVSGGVAQSGFYYVPFGVRAHATSFLPDAWKGVVVTGGDGRTYNVINIAVYAPAPP